jgi:hypothetical protein
VADVLSQDTLRKRVEATIKNFGGSAMLVPRAVDMGKDSARRNPPRTELR